MTVHTRLLRAELTLKATAADLRLMALQNSDDQGKDELNAGADELEALVGELNKRRKEVEAREPQYETSGVN